MTTQVANDTYPDSLERRTNAEWRDRADAVQTPNYGRRRLALVRGSGSRVWDAEGKEYLDFLTGISVCSLGHCHPAITKAICEQAATLVHTTNLVYIPMQIELGRLLLDHCFGERVFFCNSGLEANEAAIKIARKWAHVNRGIAEPRIITFRNSFHGRSIATLSASGQAKLAEGFAPLCPGFDLAEWNDLESVEKLISDDTCAIMIEPVQGEGGINPASRDFLAALRRICDERGLLLILDEIQTAFGRTGYLFAYEGFGVTPDVMTLAKSLGGGLAMGAMVTSEKIASVFTPGSHGSTMAGNHLTSAAALAYLRELIDGDHSRNAAVSGTYLTERLRSELEDCQNVIEVRGRGLMIGIAVREGGPEIVEDCEGRGLIVNFTGGAIRLLPPLNVTREDIDKAIEILVASIRSPRDTGR